MYPNSCHGFIGPLIDKDVCIKCGASRYIEKDGRRVSAKMFQTFLISPQIQAQWQSPEGAERMCYQIREIKNTFVDLREHEGHIPVYSDIYHSSDYLKSVQDGKIISNCILMGIFIDSTQLYRSKQSKCIIYIWILYNLSLDLQYKKCYILPGAIIPGPRTPKIIELFLFSGLQHLASLQNEGL